MLDKIHELLHGFLAFIGTKNPPCRKDAKCPGINAGRISFNGSLFAGYGQNRPWTAVGWLDHDITKGNKDEKSI